MNNKHNKQTETGMLEDKYYANKKSEGKGGPKVHGLRKASGSIH